MLWAYWYCSEDHIECWEWNRVSCIKGCPHYPTTRAPVVRSASRAERQCGEPIFPHIQHSKHPSVLNYPRNNPGTSVHGPKHIEEQCLAQPSKGHADWTLNGPFLSMEATPRQPHTLGVQSVDSWPLTVLPSPHCAPCCPIMSPLPTVLPLSQLSPSTSVLLRLLRTSWPRV